MDSRTAFQRSAPWAASLIVTAAGIGFWWTQMEVLDTFLARVGSSPLHWVHVSLDPLKSAIDWPTGTRNLGKSLPMQIYPWLHDHLGVAPKSTLQVFILVEVAATLAAFATFGRSVAPSMGALGVAVFTLIVALTSLQTMNLGRFGYPFAWGLYYSFASASRILGIAFTLQGRPWPAMMAFAFAVCVHPLMGVTGLAAGCVAVSVRGLSECRRFAVPALAAGFIAALWLFVGLRNESMAASSIPTENWFALTELFNSHWYPVEIGVFSTLYDRHWLPLLSLAVAYVAIEADEGQQGRFRIEVRLMLAALALLTAAGVAVSFLKPTPFLVKLCLHRSSDLMVVIAFLVVFRRLWQDLVHGGLLRRALAAVLILSPVMHGGWVPGFPVVISLLYALPLARAALRRAPLWPGILAASTWALAAVITAGYGMSGMIASWEAVSITGAYYLRSLWAGLGWWTVPLLVAVFLAPPRSVLPRVLLTGWVAVAVVLINVDRTRGWSTPESQQMLELQTWARENTPEDSLFMPDPGTYGGWRDMSRRASFGTAQEWLHNAWLYDSDPALFHEGMRRFGLLGLKPESFYGIGDRLDTLRTLRRAVSDRYYEATAEWFVALAENEGIDFFIFDRSRHDEQPAGLTRVYENARFAVLAPPAASAAPVASDPGESAGYSSE